MEREFGFFGMQLIYEATNDCFCVRILSGKRLPLMVNNLRKRGSLKQREEVSSAQSKLKYQPQYIAAQKTMIASEFKKTTSRRSEPYF